MDLVDIIVEKKFLGQEFLTWLYWVSMTSAGVAVKDGHIYVTFDGRIVLEDAEGKEKVTCVGESDLPEAMTGLMVGKKIQQAKVKLENDDMAYSLTLTGDLFEFKSVKLPKTASLSETAGEGGELEASGHILDRVSLFKALRETVLSLFKAFIVVRVSKEWPDELQKIRNWIADSNN